MGGRVRRHWKIYRGVLQHRDMGNEIYWSTSEVGVRKLMRDARRDSEKGVYVDAGRISYIYIEPTKQGVTNWLQRNVTHDNG